MRIGTLEGYYEFWTDDTRPKIPRNNIIGYNSEHNRIEFYNQELGKYFYLYVNEINIENPDLPTLFSDFFESGWLIDNLFIKIYGELFENNWFIDNIFNNLFIEHFEGLDW